MKRIAWHRLLALGVMGASSIGRAQVRDAQMPQATVRELATIDGYVDGFVRLPDGRTLIFEVDDSTFAYDVASKRRTLLGIDMRPSSVSPQGDRLAFGRDAEGRGGPRLWTIPIDPRTGSATGSAQLVSQRRIDNARRPRFSPDGKRLAFFSPSTKPANTWDAVLVPSTGGAESVVANYPVAMRFSWSTDGTGLDVEVYDMGTAIERVPIAGGNKRALFPITPATSTMGVGVSPDASVAIYTMNPDRFFYRTASGSEGEVRVPLPSLDDGWGYDFSLDGQNRYLSATYVLKNQGVRVMDVATGRTRAVLPGETSSGPMWSPDGRRLAVLTGNLSHLDIAIVNADGSGLRRYPVPMLLVWSPRRPERPWSPDGRFLAFFAEVGARVGYTPGNQRRLVILDVASGSTRVLASTLELASTLDYFGDLEWRADSKAIRVIKNHRVLEAPDSRRIVEIALDGAETLLRDISAEFPRYTQVVLSASGEAVVAVRVGQKTDRFVVPLGGGAARKLPDPGTEAGFANTGVGELSPGNRVVLPLGDGSGAYPIIRILSTVGDSTRTVRAPFGSVNGDGFPDGKHILVTGKAAGDSLHKLFLLSLEDGSQRLLGDISGGGAGGRLAPSPDGKLIAFTHDGRRTSKIHEIDFAPAIQAVIKR